MTLLYQSVISMRLHLAALPLHLLRALCLLIFGAILLLNIAAAQGIKAKVIRIVDGDTVEVFYDNEKKIVRLFGIQAPELFSNPIQPYAKEAKDYLEKHILNQQITLMYNDALRYDKYNRILAEIYLSAKSVNEMLLKEGLAFVYIISNTILTPDQSNRWFNAQSIALNANKNLWNSDMFKAILPEMAKDYVGRYKIIIGSIVKINNTSNSHWLQMEESGSLGFSILITNKNIANFNKYNINSLLNKKVLVHGFINQYSSKFGMFISLISPNNLFILN